MTSSIDSLQYLCVGIRRKQAIELLNSRSFHDGHLGDSYLINKQTNENKYYFSKMPLLFRGGNSTWCPINRFLCSTANTSLNMKALEWLPTSKIVMMQIITENDCKKNL